MTKKIRRIIIESKAVKTLQPRHIAATVKKYRHPYYADRYDIIVPRYTEVPPETRAFTEKKNIKIRRLRFK